MITPIHLLEGARIAGHAIKRHLLGPRRYKGSPEEICKQIVEACWDAKKEYFRTSRGNYPEFYSRDFGMCVDALLALGEKKRVKKTLQYALRIYQKHKRFRLAISPFGFPFDFPNVYAPDGFAFLLHSLAALGDRGFVDEYRDFLNQEVKRFYLTVVDPTTGLALSGKHFSGMRDYAIRSSSMYDNVMIAAVQKYTKKLGLNNPLQKWNYQELLVEEYWNGRFFEDDARHLNEVTGDANVAPFWFQLFTKKEERKFWPEIMKRFREKELDTPYALRYEPHNHAAQQMIWVEHLAGGWERDTVWLHLGNMFLAVLLRLNKRAVREYLKGHEALIQRERCYPEVLTKEGELFSSTLFHCDCSMLWAANYLWYKRALGE